MAKLVSTIFSSMRGSIAGTTYLTTPAGQIIGRQRTVPVNTPTPYRTFIKTSFTSAVARWNALTIAQRQAWAAWALANPVGPPAQTGRQQMIAAIAFQEYLTEAYGIVITDLDTAPVFHGHPSLTLTKTGFTLPGQTGVAFKVGNTSAMTCIALCELSVSLPTTRNFFKGPWDPTVALAASIVAGGTNTFSFSNLVEGQRYFARARILSFSALPAFLGRAISPSMITYSEAVTVV